MSDKIFRILGKRGRITIPFQIRQEAGLKHNDILSFTCNDGNITINREKICDNCAGQKNSTEPVPEDITLTELLDRLTPALQREALIYLLKKESENG